METHQGSIDYLLKRSSARRTLSICIDEKAKVSQEMIALQEEIERDPQLSQAINLLKGWSVMSKSYVSK